MTPPRGGRAPRVLVVQHQGSCPPALLTDPAAMPDAVVDVVRPDLGQPLPPALRGPAGSGHDALVVLGGSMSAADDAAAPWLPATRRLLAACVADGTPALGVCLGAQLLALATGGDVGRGHAGVEVGLVELQPTAAAQDDALLGPLLAATPGAPWRAVSSHGDTVTRLPEGAELLGSTATYPVQAFRVGEAAWGVQYHPEATAELLGRWLREDPEDLHELAARGCTAADLLGPVTAAAGELADGARRHGQALLDVVRARGLLQEARGRRVA